MITITKNSSKIKFQYIIKNIDLNKNIDYIFGFHPAFNINPFNEIELDAKEVEIDLEASTKIFTEKFFKWPFINTKDGEKINLSKTGSINDNLLLVYKLFNFKNGKISLLDKSDDLKISLIFDKNFFKCGYFWMNYGGWRSIYAGVLEIWTSKELNLNKACDKNMNFFIKPKTAVDFNINLDIEEK